MGCQVWWGQGICVELIMKYIQWDQDIECLLDFNYRPYLRSGKDHEGIWWPWLSEVSSSIVNVKKESSF